METRRELFTECARAMVRGIHDNIVRSPIRHSITRLTSRSVLIPWLTLRKVPVDVEIVRPHSRLLRSSLTNAPAIPQSRRSPFRARDPARSTWENQPYIYHGVPRIWYHKRGEEIPLSLYDLRRTGRFHREFG